MRSRATAVVARLLRARIESGVYAPGRPLPSPASMSSTTGRPHRAVLRAVRMLRAEGYLAHLPYYGNYVRPREEWPTHRTGPSGVWLRGRNAA